MSSFSCFRHFWIVSDGILPLLILAALWVVLCFTLDKLESASGAILICAALIAEVRLQRWTETGRRRPWDGDVLCFSSTYDNFWPDIYTRKRARIAKRTGLSVGFACAQKLKTEGAIASSGLNLLCVRRE